MLKHSKTRKSIITMGMLIPLLLGVSGCSVGSEKSPTPIKTADSNIEAVGKFDPVESPVAAKMYENYLNKLYTVQGSEIQTTIDPLVADGELSAEDTTQLVAQLKVKFPDLYGAFDIKELTDDQAATLFYSVFSLVKTLNEENVTAVITVPATSIIVKGDTAKLDAKQVIAKSENNILSLGEAPVKVDLVKIDGKWLVTPPTEVINSTK